MSRTADHPAAGWYDDPGRVADRRYWDGSQWTLGVVVDGQVIERPLPPDPPPLDSDHRIEIPASGAAWALLGAALGAVLSVAGVVVGRALTDSAVVHLLLGQAGLWTGLMGAVIVDSHRYGSGNLRRDYQLCWRGRDVGWGAVLSLVARSASTVVAVLVLLAVGASADGLPAPTEQYLPSPAAVVLLVLVLVVGAPVIEELFFRGLLMRSLEPSVGAGGAIAVQAVLFGAAHIHADATWQQNLAITSSIAAGGVVLGVVAYRTKRIAPSMWIHSFFNLIPAIFIVVHAATS